MSITPFLWYDTQAEEASNLYVSIFPNSKVTAVNRMPDGKVISTRFVLDGQEFYTLNGGPKYKFTPAISLFVNVETQDEVDTMWSKLLKGGGQEDRCGWVRDKFGLSWQIIPTILGKLLYDPNPARAQRAMQAMLGMSKIDIEGLKRAAAGNS